MNSDKEIIKALKELASIRVKQHSLRGLERHEEAAELEFDAAEIEGEIVETFRALRNESNQKAFYQRVAHALGSA